MNKFTVTTITKEVSVVDIEFALYIKELASGRHIALFEDKDIMCHNTGSLAIVISGEGASKGSYEGQFRDNPSRFEIIEPEEFKKYLTATIRAIEKLYK